MAKGGSNRPQGQGPSGAVTAPPPPSPPPAWGGSGAPGQKPQVIPGQVKPVRGDPGTATVTGFRTPPPVAAPAAGGGDNLLRSRLAMLLAQQQQHGGGNAGFGGGDRGFARSPLGQQQMAMWGIAPYPA